MKHIILFFFSIILFFGEVSFLQGNETTKEEHKNSDGILNENSDLSDVPDPLDLNINWWNYFNVPNDQLPVKIQRFKQKIEILKQSLKEDEHRLIKEHIERISFNLDMYLKKKQTPFFEESTHLQFLKNYTVDQLLRVNKAVQNTNTKLRNEKEIYEMEKGNLSRIKSKLDELFLQYPNAPNASVKKIEIGLSLINKRIEQAITEANLYFIRKKIEYLEIEKKRLDQELNFARSHMNFQVETEEKLKKELVDSEKKVDEEKKNLYKLQKQAFYEERKNLENKLNCCLWDNKVLTQSVITEQSKIENLIKEIKYLLFVFSNNSDTYSAAELQKLATKYQEVAAEGRSNIKQWEEIVKNEQARMGKQIEQTPTEQKNKEPFEDTSLIIDIHLEMDQIIAHIQELKIQIQNAELLIKQIDWYIIKEKGLHETWWILLQRNLQGTFETFIFTTNYTLFHVYNKPVTVLNFLQAFLIFIFTILLSKIFKRAIFNEKYISKKLSPSTQYIIARCLHYIFMIVGLIVALSFIGLDFTNFLIFAGALGVGIGFGMQSLFNNIFSGLLLLLQRNIKVGDIVELTDDFRGRVQEITLQNTHIHSFEGLDLIVPNSQLTSQLLNNWTLHDTCRRYRIPFHVPLNSNKELIRDIVLNVANKLPSVKKDDPRYANPQLWLMNFNEFGMSFELVVWVDLSINLPTGITKPTLLWNIHSALQENGISISYPHKEIYIKESAAESC